MVIAVSELLQQVLTCLGLGRTAVALLDTASDPPGAGQGARGGGECVVAAGP